MSTADALDRVLPVLTLILGAVLTQLGQRPTRRREAAHLLASMKRQVWSRDQPGGWLDFQEYLGKLWIELRMAGVPRSLVSQLETAAEAFWAATEDSGDPEIGVVLQNPQLEKDLDRARGDVYDWLDSSWNPLRRRRLRHRAK